MSDERLTKGYRGGCHRLVPPEQTLARITPMLDEAGITRLADITGLDRLGIPTFCAMRPTARLVQTSNGKGLEANDARVSALMEALEVHHVENPQLSVVRASYAALRAESRPVVQPSELPEFRRGNHDDDDRIVEWVHATELHSGTRCLLPASAAYPKSPSLYAWSTNGLASGNHLVEATLHGIYEVIERHALAQAAASGSDAGSDALAVLRPRVKYYRIAKINSPPVMQLCERIEAAKLKLQLASVASAGRTHTFWAILLDEKPLALSTLVNTGYGTHMSPSVAAIRAITEAAQSRLSMIHASREDLTEKAAFLDPDHLHRAYAYFDNISAGGHWPFLKDRSCASLSEDYDTLLSELRTEGFDRIYRVDLTRAPFDLPVVKVIIPGTRLDHRMV